MAEGLTSDLLRAAFCIGLLCFWIASRNLSIFTAFYAALVKVLIPLVYFAFFLDGTWIFLDDITYQFQGTKMLQLGYNPITALVNPDGLSNLMSLSGGRHVLYGWWNILGQYLFGKYYYSPVFLNVSLTFISGYFLFRIAHLSGFSRKYAQGLLLFSLFHWEIVAWSSFLNLKDPIIMTLTIIAIYLILRLSKQLKFYDLLGLGGVIFIFFWIRFYVPVVIMIATGIWLSLFQKGWRRYILLFLAAIGSIFVIFFLGLENTLYNFNRLEQNWTTILLGVIRMALTPQPWSIEPEYTFLFFPSILHWVLFIPAICGGWMLWRCSREVKFLFVYLVLTLFLYGAFYELQGPRQRLQITPIIAWAQFHFLWVVLKIQPPRIPLKGHLT
ncbi:hypothetical protein [Coleofasciculus sp. FACHB-SPT36]|uniref:hypothetical protein n=1 Tax=Cyanophyceae TaxID=3028117 RepID=UPI00168BB8DB|nr:hypothetical protein [Coleofasciculus sp. FACHB-SPT36]MBD2538443.1 hypothetical protein [Coleofasciculus sp. FACHB-SPT36]